MDERGVEGFVNTLECNPKEVVVGLQYALLHGETLHMAHAVNVFQHIYHRVVDNDRLVGG